MKFIIPIDRSTLRKNPDAGRTNYAVPGPKSVERYVEYNDGPNGVSEEWRGNGNGEFFMVSQQRGPKHSTDERVVQEFEHQECVTFSTMMPAPDWLFSYLPTPVTCSNCGATFPHTELGSDYIYTGEDDVPLDNICPTCGTPDCCEIEFEQP